MAETAIEMGKTGVKSIDFDASRASQAARKWLRLAGEGRGRWSSESPSSVEITRRRRRNR